MTEGRKTQEKRVRYEAGYISQTIDWRELVASPLEERRYREAFSAADSIIDQEIETTLRQIYNDHKCQDLINEMHLLRGQAGFEGLVIAQILESKTILSPELMERIRKFKKARNLVLHNTEAQYAFVIGNQNTPYQNQEEFDHQAESEANKWIFEAQKIFIELVDLSKNLKPEHYFSEEFYQKNSRGKQAQKKYPK